MEKNKFYIITYNNDFGNFYYIVEYLDHDNMLLNAITIKFLRKYLDKDHYSNFYYNSIIYINQINIIYESYVLDDCVSKIKLLYDVDIYNL